MINLVMQKIGTNQANKLDLKHQCYNHIYVITVMQGTINVTDPKNNAYDKKLTFKNNDHSLVAFPKLIIHSLIMQKI